MIDEGLDHGSPVEYEYRDAEYEYRDAEYEYEREFNEKRIMEEGNDMGRVRAPQSVAACELCRLSWAAAPRVRRHKRPARDLQRPVS